MKKIVIALALLLSLCVGCDSKPLTAYTTYDSITLYAPTTNKVKIEGGWYDQVGVYISDTSYMNDFANDVHIRDIIDDKEMLYVYYYIYENGSRWSFGLYRIYDDPQPVSDSDRTTYFDEVGSEYEQYNYREMARLVLDQVKDGKGKLPKCEILNVYWLLDTAEAPANYVYYKTDKGDYVYYEPFGQEGKLYKADAFREFASAQTAE